MELEKNMEKYDSSIYLKLHGKHFQRAARIIE